MNKRKTYFVTRHPGAIEWAQRHGFATAIVDTLRSCPHWHGGVCGNEQACPFQADDAMPPTFAL